MTVTNVMRLLKQAGVPFEASEYEVDESDLSGVHLAAQLGVEPDCVFKTLVTRGEKNGLHVFCIPAPAELDLEKVRACGGREKDRNAAHEGSAADDRLYSRRLFSGRYEEKISHNDGRNGDALRQDLCFGRSARRAGDRGSAAAGGVCGRRFCRRDQIKRQRERLYQ